jgi:hypothetical protein
MVLESTSDCRLAMIEVAFELLAALVDRRDPRRDAFVRKARLRMEIRTCPFAVLAASG